MRGDRRPTDDRRALVEARSRWRALLDRAEIDLPSVAEDVELTLRAALAEAPGDPAAESALLALLARAGREVVMSQGARGDITERWVIRRQEALAKGTEANDWTGSFASVTLVLNTLIGVAAMFPFALAKLGAYDFIEKPPESERILLVARNALSHRKLSEENRRLKLSFDDRYRMEGESAAVEKVS